ncbi:MAG TPA: hypothetical protein VH593_13020 [Ktedonobacteraceae bacterium]|jgi:hypothetical protein
MAEGDKPTLGLMVLYRTGVDRYSPAVIHKMNKDNTVDLTVFDPSGSISPARNVQEGAKPGQWCHTGVDAREAVIAAIKKTNLEMKPVETDLGRHGATGPDDKMAKSTEPVTETKK